MKPEKFIGAQLRLKLTDLRVLDGVLTVVDPFGNLYSQTFLKYLKIDWILRTYTRGNWDW